MQAPVVELHKTLFFLKNPVLRVRGRSKDFAPVQSLYTLNHCHLGSNHVRSDLRHINTQPCETNQVEPFNSKRSKRAFTFLSMS